MSQRYSFLKDETALAEIRKHQWIESEKRGAPIGFSPAAMDWINKYGQEFLKYHDSAHTAV